MIYLPLSNIEPLYPLLDFNIDNTNFDLHNDFKCTSINFSSDFIEIVFKRFGSSENRSNQNIVIFFADILQTNLELIHRRCEEGRV